MGQEGFLRTCLGSSYLDLQRHPPMEDAVSTSRTEGGLLRLWPSQDSFSGDHGMARRQGLEGGLWEDSRRASHRVGIPCRMAGLLQFTVNVHQVSLVTQQSRAGWVGSSLLEEIPPSASSCEGIRSWASPAARPTGDNDLGPRTLES
ncbi:Hypothetical predicted protein [Marmota monax]|uniref:Uncharacterized protein n=1 Tax=Marmota monax TaxID=9995 RepID=A0A5E4CLA1_MARMO|nr:hypothetical protein GHT09_012044 [Marmota monax]VTJ82100.1 Hypothetical predicted protein [Marmota monax]